jgi:hypothetical protein
VRDAEAVADDVLIRVRDRRDREVILLARIWTDKILRDHPEMAGYLEAVMAVVRAPEHVEGDALPGRERVYRQDAGPSRGLLVVVSFEQQPGRVITALANRKDPKLWKP